MSNFFNTQGTSFQLNGLLSKQNLYCFNNNNKIYSKSRKIGVCTNTYFKEYLLKDQNFRPYLEQQPYLIHLLYKMLEFHQNLASHFCKIIRASYKITVLDQMIKSHNDIYIYNSIVRLKITSVKLKNQKICETKLISIQNIYTLICNTTSFLWIAREFYYLKLFSLDMYKIINKHRWLKQVTQFGSSLG